MKRSSDSSIILIENPLTGNQSFAKAFKLQDVPDVPQHVQPDEARATVDGWEKATKIILLRHPLARFESAASALVAGADSDNWPEEFANFMQEMADVRPHPGARAAAILDYMESSDVWPVQLRPQTSWLKAKFDVMLATHDIANYATAQGVHCQRSNQFARNPRAADSQVHCNSVELQKRLIALYAGDYARFADLPLWSPDPKQVRLMSGYCATCTEKVHERSQPAKKAAPKKKVDSGKKSS